MIDFFNETLSGKKLKKQLQELYHPKWLPPTPIIEKMADKRFKMSNLRILHLPKLQNTMLT